MFPPTCHKVHVTTATIPRTSIVYLPDDYGLTCDGANGWRLLRAGDSAEGSRVVVAGEFDKNGLRLDVDGHVIVDSLQYPTGARPPQTPALPNDN